MEPQEIPVEEIVPGDIVILNAGDVIPGDCLLLESKDLFVDEATLTGETYPVEKSVGGACRRKHRSASGQTRSLWEPMWSAAAPRRWSSSTGKETEFGKVSERLKLRPQETEFEHGVRRFGYFLMEVTLVLVIAIFAINVYLARPVLDSFLFSLALAVGLTPQLLPAIISINLAHGAKRMAQEKVIVKRLASIENFGSMNVLCSDKTGTLTEGVVHLHSALDVDGAPSEKVLLYAYLNAFYETGFTNPIDEAIRTHRQFDLSGYQKLDEIPYDFIRKRLSILVSHGRYASDGDQRGAAECARGLFIGGNWRRNDCGYRHRAGTDPAALRGVQPQGLSHAGGRLQGYGLRIASSPRTDEADMTFLGFLVLFDPPKPGHHRDHRQPETSRRFTEDHHRRQPPGCRQCQSTDGIIEYRKSSPGRDLRQMSDEALLKRVNDVDVFAEVEPNQKERIILALKKAGQCRRIYGRRHQ